MRTEVLPVDAISLARAASLLRAGEVVAFPTETVYGLGADAFNAEAVAKIFAAKERPADNPLIAHIADHDMLPSLVASVSPNARRLMEALWPGALTLILPKTPAVPAIVSAGLQTVAVRMPSHPAAQALIRAAGCPIAAPSANRSGRPSPTTAAHVLADMDGRIPLILDGGNSGYGVESTVLDMTGEIPTVLRPGGVTIETLQALLPALRVDDAVLRPLAQGAAARSPGMKHRHYAPTARVVVVRGNPEAVAEKACALYDAAEAPAAILCPAARVAVYGARRTHALGTDEAEMAARLFGALRALDAQGIGLIIAEGTGTGGMGLALMNRLLRAADFDVVEA